MGGAMKPAAAAAELRTEIPEAGSSPPPSKATLDTPPLTGDAKPAGDTLLPRAWDTMKTELLFCTMCTAVEMVGASPGACRGVPGGAWLW